MNKQIRRAQYGHIQTLQKEEGRMMQLILSGHLRVVFEAVSNGDKEMEEYWTRVYKTTGSSITITCHVPG